MTTALIIILGLSAIIHGFLWAARSPCGVIAVPGEVLRARALLVALQEATLDTETTPIYLASDSGIHPARGIFLAQLNGERAVIIETGDNDAPSI